MADARWPVPAVTRRLVLVDFVALGVADHLRLGRGSRGHSGTVGSGRCALGGRGALALSILIRAARSCGRVAPVLGQLAQIAIRELRRRRAEQVVHSRRHRRFATGGREEHLAQFVMSER
jgi:hypothetical protein